MTFRTGAGPACNPLLGIPGARGAGAPEHERSGAASRPRIPSTRVVSCPAFDATQMGDSELFVSFAFLVSVGVVACIFASCIISLVAMCTRHFCPICRCSWYRYLCTELQHCYFSALVWRLISRSVLPWGWYARPLLASWGRRCVLIIPGGGSTYAHGGRQSPPSPTRFTGLASWYMGALDYSIRLCSDPA